MKSLILPLVLGSLVIGAFGQQSQKGLAFEAASIKASKTEEGSDSHTSTGYFNGSASLKGFVRMAYGVTNEQIEGGPKWLDIERYDIEAKSDGPAKGPQLMEMLQTLLSDRFKLQLHRERRMETGYALVVAKGGLKIKEVQEGQSHSTNTGSGALKAVNVTFVRLASSLSRVLGAPVTDETGISGFCNIELKWSPESTRLSTAIRDADAGGPSIFTAMEEQLGLKLDGRKVPVEMIVVDSAEKPALD